MDQGGEEQTYRIDFDRGVKIIRAVHPPIVLVNGLISTRVNEFCDRLRDNNFSIYEIKGEDVNVAQIQSYMAKAKSSFNHYPIVFKASILDPEIIYEIFDDDRLFTYIYLYPNNQLGYRDRISADIDSGSFAIPAYYPQKIADVHSSGKSVSHLVVALTNLNKEIYTRHLETFDKGILTILV